MEHREIMKRLFVIKHLHFLAGQRAADGNNELFYGQIPFIDVIHRKGSCSQKELAEALKISPAGVTKTLKVLEARGLVEKRIDEKDSRKFQLTITDKAMEIMEERRRVFEKIDEKIFEGISDEEKQQLFEILGKMKDNLERE